MTPVTNAQAITSHVIAIASGLLETIELDAYRKALDDAENVGHLLDMDAWLRNAELRREMIAYIGAAVAFRNARRTWDAFQQRQKEEADNAG